MAQGRADLPSCQRSGAVANCGRIRKNFAPLTPRIQPQLSRWRTNMGESGGRVRFLTAGTFLESKAGTCQGAVHVFDHEITPLKARLQFWVFGFALLVDWNVGNQHLSRG